MTDFGFGREQRSGALINESVSGKGRRNVYFIFIMISSPEHRGHSPCWRFISGVFEIKFFIFKWIVAAQQHKKCRIDDEEIGYKK